MQYDLKTIPFPGREKSIEVLRQDYVFNKIPLEQHEVIVCIAWERGKQAARQFLKKDGRLVDSPETADFVQIMLRNNFTIQYFDQDFVSGNIRYFADIQPKSKHVCIYTRSIQLWAEKNECTYELAEELILMHEYFHYWDSMQIKSTSRLYMVPTIIIGPIRLGKTGVAALCEIAANAFVWELCEVNYLDIVNRLADRINVTNNNF